MRGLILAPILSYGREIGQIVTFGRSLTQEGSSCTTGQRRKYTLSWTTNSAVNDADFNMKLYEQVDGGGYNLIYTETSPKSNQSYIRETDYYAASGGDMVNIDFKAELYYTPPVPDVKDDEDTDDEGDLWWGYFCS